MLDLYTWHTPNGKKPPILLAELDWPYDLHLVNLGQNEQKQPEYLRINPNGKIPALVDTERSDGGLVTVFESGAILQYLAEKAGRFLPSDQPGRSEVLSWVYWQVGVARAILRSVDRPPGAPGKATKARSPNFSKSPNGSSASSTDS